MTVQKAEYAERDRALPDLLPEALVYVDLKKIEAHRHYDFILPTTLRSFHPFAH